MKNLFYFILLIAYQTNTSAQTALSSDFTYQGNLTLNGIPTDGIFDFDMYLYDAASSGNEVGQLLLEDIEVDMGFFNIELDFGDTPFSGDQVWLEIRVREGDSIGGFTQLLPRQKINSTPYAIHAQFVGSGAIGNLEIQDGSITNNKLAINAVTTDKIADGEVDNADLADDAVTQSKLADNVVGANQAIASEVQLRLTGGCTQGQYVSAVNEDGSIQCIDNPDGSAAGVCKTLAGDPGILINNVCVLSYSNGLSSNWNTAVNACSLLGGDLCSVSQYQAIRKNNNLFYLNRAVWSNDFSDNDSNVKVLYLNSSDNPNSIQLYSYACCGNVLPEPIQSRVTAVNGVNTTYIHTQEDTTWTAASNICTTLSSDLCTKAQYVALNDAGTFTAAASKATAEMSDNDSDLFDSVVGINASDNPSATDYYAFACCGMSNKPVDLSCPGTLTANGICLGTIHDTEDTNFFDAARACHNQGANLCSKSQMQAIRNVGQFFGQCWTNDGADNDGNNVGGLLNIQPDNPNPSTDEFGYACCY